MPAAKIVTNPTRKARFKAPSRPRLRRAHRAGRAPALSLLQFRNAETRAIRKSRTESPSSVNWKGGLSYQRSLRSEEHTSELQSQSNLVCRLLLEKKKKV